MGSVLVSPAILTNHRKSSVLNKTELLSYSSGVQKPDMGLTGLKSRASWTSQVALVVKNLPANAGDVGGMGSIPGSGRSPGGGHGNPLHYSCLENPMDREDRGLQSIGSQSRTRLKQQHIYRHEEFGGLMSMVISLRSCFHRKMLLLLSHISHVRLCATP